MLPATASLPYEQKLAHLREQLVALPGCVVAFSAGVDSTALLHACRDVLGDRVVAVPRGVGEDRSQQHVRAQSRSDDAAVLADEAEPGEGLTGDAVAALRLVAEGEQRLVTSGPGARRGDLDGLIDGQVGARKIPRRVGKGAITAHVAAQLGEGDEDLGRIADPITVRGVPSTTRGFHQRVEIGLTGQQDGHVIVDDVPAGCSVDDGVGAHGHGVTLRLLSPPDPSASAGAEGRVC